MHAIWDAASRLYGEYGTSKMNLYLVTYDAQKRIAILRTTQESVDLTRATLATITEIGVRPAAVHVLRISGTIKTLHKKMGWKQT